MLSALVNGSATEMLSVHDRGFQYGDGLFETLAVRDGRALAWPAHFDRLARGCAALGIPGPAESLLAAEAAQLCKGHGRGVLKITVSRGSGGRGYGPPPDPQPTRVVTLHAWPDYPREYWSDGIAVAICNTRLGHQPSLAGLKHLNRLEQVLARGELAAARTAEGLVLDSAGHIIEGTMSNVFMIRASELLTPDLGLCGVAGIVRARVLARAADWGLKAQVCELSIDDLRTAEEVFFTNSIIGVWRARRVGSQDLPPGRRSREIAGALAAEDCILEP